MPSPGGPGSTPGWKTIFHMPQLRSKILSAATKTHHSQIKKKKGCEIQAHTHTYIHVCVCSVTKSCPTLWDLMNCSLPDSSVQGIFQARILEWVAISSRESSQPRDQTHVSCVSCFGRGILYHWATWEAHIHIHTYTHNDGILLNHKKWKFAICNNMGGPGGYYA